MLLKCSVTEWGRAKPIRGKRTLRATRTIILCAGTQKTQCTRKRAALLEKLLVMLRDDGEKKVFRYIRKELMKKRDY